MREEEWSVVLVELAAILSLTVLAITYWLIMREDSTVLTIISASIGGLIGYTAKKVKGR